jgi:Arc-like DNA binding domain
MARRKPADTVHLRLRFPERLRRRIEVAAEKNQQSMNLEIVERLERSFQREDDEQRNREVVEQAAGVALATYRLAELAGRAEPTDSETDPQVALQQKLIESFDNLKLLEPYYDLDQLIDQVAQKIRRKVEAETVEKLRRKVEDES